jgi:hypothetical protein
MGNQLFAVCADHSRGKRNSETHFGPTFGASNSSSIWSGNVAPRTRLSFVFAYGHMRGREKFEFRIYCRAPDVARAELGALA